MPVTEDQYNRRSAILAKATPEQKPRLQAAFAEYEKSKLPLSVQVAQAREREAPPPGAGANVLESEGHETPPPELMNEGTRTDWVSQTPPEEDATTRLVGPAEGVSAKAGQALAVAQRPTGDMDLSLPNASKLKKFAEPPEYAPAGTHLPDYIGGSTIHLHEPSQEKFQADMGPILRARGIPDDPNDRRYQDLYSEYADKMYSEAYKQAVATNTPIVRVDYVLQHNKGIGALADYLAAKGTAKTFAFTEGAMNGIVPGSTAALLGAAQPLTDQPLLDQYREGQAANPVTAGIGTLVGSVSPASLPGEAAGGIARAVGMGTAGRRIGGAAMAGALSSAGASVLGNASEGNAPNDMMQEMSSTVPIGLLLGAGGQALAEGAGAYRSHLRAGRLGKELGSAEGSGIATDAVRGLKAPPEIHAAIEEARPPVPGEQKSYFEGSPVEYQARQVEGPLADANRVAFKQATERIKQETANYIASHPETHSQQPMAHSVRAVADELRARSLPMYRGVNQLPSTAGAMAGYDSLNGGLSRWLQDSVVPKIVTVTDAGSAGLRQGAVVEMTLGEAKRAFPGFDPKAILENEHMRPEDPRRMLLGNDTVGGAAGPGRPQSGDDVTLVKPGDTERDISDDVTRNLSSVGPEAAFRVVLVPRSYNAADMDMVISRLHQLAKAGKKLPSEEKFWETVQASALKDRERFGPGWAKLKDEHHQVLTALEQRASDAGLPAGGDMLPSDVQAFRAKLEQAGAPKQAAATKEALGSLAGEAGAERGLGLLKGQRAYDALKASTKLNANPIVTSGGAYERLGNIGAAAALRLDAIARALERNPEGLSSITTREVGPELMATIRQMSQRGKVSPLAATRAPPGALLNMFGMGGGGLGLRAAQVYSTTGHDALSDEDIANLLTLLKAKGPAQQEAR